MTNGARLRVLLAHSPDMLANYYGARALAALREHGDVVLNESGRVLDDPAALARAAAGAHVIVADRQTPVGAEALVACPDLLAVCRVAIDIRNIDVDAASAAGIMVTQATAGFVPAVAELVVGFMIGLARGITASTADYHAGREPPVRIGRQLAGSTLGIIGYGAIGRHLAPLGTALGMTVLVSDPYATAPGAENVALADLLARADFVVCLAVANAATENLMDAAAFAAMKPGAHFINPSRGNLVDEAALAHALTSGHLGGAAMDVGRAPDQKPSPGLAALPGMIATPHIGGLTPEAAEHQAFDTVAQVAALARGTMPPGAVNAGAARRWLAWAAAQGA